MSGTLREEGGAFGVALGALGFGEGIRYDTTYQGLAWAFDHAESSVRVICWVDDGERVTVLHWVNEPKMLEPDWRVEFDGGTPLAVAVAAIATAASK